MGVILPGKLMQQPQGAFKLAYGSAVRSAVAAFVASGGGIRITGNGKHDRRATPTGLGIATFPRKNGYASRPVAGVTTNTFRLNSVANQFDTVWERPKSQVTIMAVFRRYGSPIGGSPFFGNQCPNNDPFTAWGLIDQANNQLVFETSAGGVNRRCLATEAIVNDILNVIIARYDGETMTLWTNGRNTGSTAASGQIVYPSQADRGPAVGNFFDFTGAQRSAQMEIYGGALWDTALSNAEIAALSANPWQVIDSPQLKVVPYFVESSGPTGLVSWSEANEVLNSSLSSTVYGSTTLVESSEATSLSASARVSSIGSWVEKTEASAAQAVLKVDALCNWIENPDLTQTTGRADVLAGAEWVESSGTSSTQISIGNAVAASASWAEATDENGLVANVRASAALGWTEGTEANTAQASVGNAVSLAAAWSEAIETRSLSVLLRANANAGWVEAGETSYLRANSGDGQDEIDALLVPPRQTVVFEGSRRIVAFEGSKRVVSFEGSKRMVDFQ